MASTVVVWDADGVGALRCEGACDMVVVFCVFPTSYFVRLLGAPFAARTESFVDVSGLQFAAGVENCVIRFCDSLWQVCLFYSLFFVVDGKYRWQDVMR